MKNRIFPVIFTCAAIAATSFCSAKPLSLYAEPKADAKIVGTIDSNAGISVIYTPAKSDWIKVGDPSNGNVGWIKSTELGNGSSSSFTFSQQIINTNQGPRSYIIQFGTPQGLTSSQSQDLFKQLQLRQQAIEDGIHQMMQDLFKNMSPTWINFPVIMPLVIMPEQKKTSVQSSHGPTGAGKMIQTKPKKQ